MNPFCSGNWLTKTLSVPGEKDYFLVESGKEMGYVLLKAHVLDTCAVCMCLSEQSAALGMCRHTASPR